MLNGRLTNRCLFITMAVIVTMDLFTKFWATQSLVLNMPKPLMPFVNLTLVHNQGAAFSFLSDQSGWQRWLLSGIAVVVIGFFSRWMLTTPVEQRYHRIGLAMIIAGALGNLIDRLYLGYVIDFIDVYVKQWHWPAFNIADSAICIGVFILILSTIGERHDKS